MFRSSKLLLAALSLSPSSAASVIRRQSVSTNAAAGWTYQGCYTDQVSSRVLAGTTYTDSKSMTEEACIQFCGKAGYNFAGMEYAAECYCDYAIASSSTKQPDSDCSMACTGNPSEACGAGNRLTVFSTPASQGPAVNPGPNGWNSLGCYSDVVSARTLRYSQSVSGGMSVSQCTAVCQQYGFQYSGVEYASECYCDNSLQNNAAPASSGCNMACSGNSSELCGGPNRLNLYQLPSSAVVAPKPGSLPAGWYSIGCFTDDVSARTLSQGQPVPGGYTNMTIEGCVGVCQSLGYSLAGLEYSQECYCDNTPKNGGSCASDQTTCNMLCKGNSAETCGGPNRLNMYQYGSSGAVASCPANQATISATATSRSTSALPASSSSITSAGPSSVTPSPTASSQSITTLPVTTSSTIIASSTSITLSNSTIATASASTIRANATTTASGNSTTVFTSAPTVVVNATSTVSANSTTITTSAPTVTANATSTALTSRNTTTAMSSSSVTVVSSGIPSNSANATTSASSVTVISSGIPSNSANATTGASTSSTGSAILPSSTVTTASTLGTTTSLATSISSSTSPLTTTRPSTTTTSSSTSTSTTTTSTGCVATDGVRNSYYISNGDFETGSLSPNYINQNTGVSYTILTNGSSIRNCNSLLLNGGASSSTRYIDIAFPFVLSSTNYATYQFSINVGRLNSNPTQSNVQAGFYFQYSGSGELYYSSPINPVCGSSSSPCSIKGHGGTVWNNYLVTFNQNPAPTTFFLRFFFLDSYAANEPVLLDDLVVYG